MTMLLGHISSIEAYDLLGLGRDSLSQPRGMTPEVRGTIESLALLNTSSLEQRRSRIARLTELPLPAHIIVSNRPGLKPSHQVVPHGWSYGQPYSDLASVNLAAATPYVCPPEMALMQMARALSRPKLALLVDQVVGSYRILRPKAVPFYKRLSNVGFERADSSSSNAGVFAPTTVYGLPPLSSIETIRSYVAAMPSAWGSRLLGRSLSLAADGLASPLEAQVYALAFCGRVNGSAGIPKPLVNSRLEVSGPAQRLFGSSWIKPDYFWPDAGVAVEATGFLWHGGRQGTADTSRRMKGYEAMGIRAMTLTSPEVYDLLVFEGILHQLAGWLGHDIPEETPHFRQRRAWLRSEVLGIRGTRVQLSPEDDDAWLDALLASYNATGA